MHPILLMLIVAAVVVAFFMVGLSITLIVKGRHMQTEVGENDHMKALGLKCAMQQIREDEGRLTGQPCDEPPGACSESDCSGCGVK